MSRICRFGLLSLGGLVLTAALGSCAEPAVGKERDTPAWVEPMKKVHARFTGTPGTFAEFGDSITVTLAFWTPLHYEVKGLSPEDAKARELVLEYVRPECWDKWKGPEHGSEGGMTIRWADDNIERWLKALNPEVAVLMFGTNDLGQLDVREYEQKTRRVVERCLKNGTIVLITTIPPRSGMLEKAKQFAEVQRRIAHDLDLPLIDYQAEILRRRPQDWDGSLAKFKETPGSEYEVPTLVARDGVHPSYPKAYQDYSEEGLNHNGYVLRNYLTLLTYADVIRRVLQK